MDYAIFRAGGKQYRVRPRDVIDVDKLPVDPGDLLAMDEVLAISRDGNLHVGRPLVAGARVVAQVQAQTRDRKIIVFKYKRKVRYRRKRGHRQPYTRLAIRELLLDGEEPSEEWSQPAVSVLDADDDTLVEEDEIEAEEDEIEEEADEEIVDQPEDAQDQPQTEEDAGPDDEGPDEEGAP